MSATNKEIITDVKDVQHFEPNTFPYVLYFDEVECGNPLGSHKGVHKIGMLYISLRCFPTHMYSKLENIILYTAVPSKALKDLDVLLNYCIAQMNALNREGLIIHNTKIKFKMIGLVGDNLGQHQILGFVESFSANFYCIRCKAHRDVCRQMCRLNSSLLRTQANYAEDVSTGNLSETGISRPCILNKIQGYDVTCDIIFDIMHDLLEGVCNVAMSGVITVLCKYEHITLNLINNRIECFNFNTHSNRPISISQRNIDRKDLGMSASEMKNLVIYFSVIMGDIVPQDCGVWNYYLLMQQILDILLAKSITHDTINYLGGLIEEHHAAYLNFFGPLKPKTHNMLHYLECLRRFGPLSHNWSMRFEAMHFKFKQYTQTVRSRLNICKSMCIRHNYTVAHSVLNDFSDDEKIATSLTCVDIEGIVYKLDSLVSIQCENVNPMFGIIRCIFSDGKRNTIGFVIDVLETVCIFPHMYSYVVDLRSKLQEIILPKECSEPLSHKACGNIAYVSAFGL